MNALATSRDIGHDEAKLIENLSGLERLLTKREAAAHFRCTTKTIERWEARGMKRIGRLYKVSECEEWLRKNHPERATRHEKKAQR